MNEVLSFLTNPVVSLLVRGGFIGVVLKFILNSKIGNKTLIDYAPKEVQPYVAQVSAFVVSMLTSLVSGNFAGNNGMDVLLQSFTAALMCPASHDIVTALLAKFNITEAELEKMDNLVEGIGSVATDPKLKVGASVADIVLKEIEKISQPTTTLPPAVTAPSNPANPGVQATPSVIAPGSALPVNPTVAGNPPSTTPNK
jgi:hypothetical protein